MGDFIFVFGSNLAGRHGKGAAKDAVKYYGAEYGNPKGLQGQSYAIPTKDKNLKPLSLLEIEEYIREFLYFAASHPDLRFNLTPIGTGLAGYTKRQVWELLQNYEIPCNIYLSYTWLKGN